MKFWLELRAAMWLLICRFKSSQTTRVCLARATLYKLIHQLTHQLIPLVFQTKDLNAVQLACVCMAIITIC